MSFKRSCVLWWLLLSVGACSSSPPKTEGEKAPAQKQEESPVLADDEEEEATGPSIAEGMLSAASPLSQEPALIEKVTTDYEPFLAALRAKDRPQLESAAAQILAVKPDDSLVLNGLAHFHRQAGRTRLAEILIKRVLANDPNDLRGLRNLAMIYWQKGETGKALGEFHKIYERDRDFPGVAYNMSVIYFKAGVYPAAEELLADLYRKEPALSIAVPYAQSLAENGKLDRALQVIAQVLQEQGIDVLEKSAEGRALLASYLQVLEVRPDKLKDEGSRLQLLSRSTDAALADRARRLVAKEVQ